ncbi:MAG: type II secretion system protein J [Chthoniobacteraceae bacterium]
MKKRSGFTMIELLISVSTLAVIVLLVTQLLNSAAVTTLHCGKLMDSDSQARMIFAQMAEDFMAMYQRADLNYYFKSQTGNDAFYFYSQKPGHIASQDPAGTGDSSLNTSSLVGYRVSDAISGGNRVELERLGRGLHWVDVASQSGADGHATSILHLPLLIKDTFSQAIADTYNNSSNPNPGGSATAAQQWDVIGDQVLRMEFCFLLTDGTLSLTPVVNGTTVNNLTATAAPNSSADSTAGYAIGSRWYDTNSQIAYACTDATAGEAVWAPLGLQDVKAIVVTIALIDSKSRASTTVGALIRAISGLPDASTELLKDASLTKPWAAKAKAPATFVSSYGLSHAAASSIRVYERFFYLK